MKQIQSFEVNLRGMKFADFDAARSYLKGHSMTVEYAMALLIEREVLAALPDGSLAGMTVPARVVGTKGGLNVPGTWSPKWPDRSVIEDLLGKKRMRFRELLAKLKEDGVRGANHWSLVRCIAFMKRTNMAYTDAEGCLALGLMAAQDPAAAPVEDFDEGGAVDDCMEGTDTKYVQALKAACLEVGNPYETVAVAKAFEKAYLKMFGKPFSVSMDRLDLMAEQIAFVTSM